MNITANLQAPLQKLQTSMPFILTGILLYLLNISMEHFAARAPQKKSTQKSGKKAAWRAHFG